MAAGAGAPTRLRILGIDVGVINLALAVGTCTPAYTDVAIEAVEVVNMMLPCVVPGCALPHSGMAADRVAHVLRDRAAQFAAADTVVIERQPPGGLRDVEQVFLAALRAKARVIAPATMHVAIGSNGLEYAARKQVSIAAAERWVPALREWFPKPDDAADAVCLVLTHVWAKAKEVAAQEAAAASAAVAASAGLDLAQYRYSGRLSAAKAFARKPLRGRWWSPSREDAPPTPPRPPDPSCSPRPLTPRVAPP
jgi:Holliday junction resolvasome RuvABC endonuclease subunit